jgi:hypothetical protein
MEEKTLETNPISFAEFMKRSFENIEKTGGEVFLGYVVNGVWTDYDKGKSNWNTVKAVFPDKEPRYRKIDSFLEDYNNYVEEFQNWQKMISRGFKF